MIIGIISCGVDPNQSVKILKTFALVFTVSKPKVNLQNVAKKKHFLLVKVFASVSYQQLRLSTPDANMLFARRAIRKAVLPSE